MTKASGIASPPCPLQDQAAQSCASRRQVCPVPTKTASPPPAITPPQESGGNDDLRNARLSLYSGPAAGAVEALRDHHVEDLGEARHPAGRIFHDAGRRIPSGTDLSAGVAIARRSREEMDRISERSRMDR